MKKLVFILFAFVLVFAIKAGATGSASKKSRVCSGSGYEVAYTIREDRICLGSGYEVAYTIREDRICLGSGYEVAYTIRDY